MVSPRSGSLSSDELLLRIESDVFDLYIQGKPFHPTVEQLSLHRSESEEWVEASLGWEVESPLLSVQKVEVFSPVEGALVDAGTERIYPCFYENQNYGVLIRRKQTDVDLSFYHDNPTLRQRVRSIEPDVLMGTLNFDNEVGYTEFEVRLNGRAALRVRLEIFPSKMDYKEDYEVILKDVNEQIHNLAFDFLKKTYNLTGLKETQNQSLTEFFSILQKIFEQLVRTVETISAMPHHRLEQEHRIAVADRVKKAGKENVAFLSKRPHLLVKDDQHGVIHVAGQKYRPTKLIESSRVITYDTAENRFLRWMLKRIGVKLKEIRTRLVSGGNRYRSPTDVSLQGRLARIAKMETQLGRLLRSDFLRDVGEMKQMNVTLVLQMAPGYRDVYRFYLMLLKGLALEGDLFRLSMKDVAQLYEYWCFLKIHDLLRQKYQLVSQDLLRVNRGGLFVTLDRSKSASVKYMNPKNGETFTLRYNAELRDMLTLAQKPDNVLTLQKFDAKGRPHPIEHKYVFDAKYRLNPASEGSSYKLKYKTPGPQEDDINTMHRYRDAIVYQDGGNGAYERSMYGAYVLFPYRNQEQFKQHKFYQSIQKVDVGAFPFLPGSTKLLEDFLEELIEESPEKAFERATQPRGTEDYFSKQLGGLDVIVGALRTREQLDINLEHLFYHMPLKNLQKHHVLTQLNWVAIYQSKKWFKEDAGIRFVGRIKGWEVVKRREIVEIPTEEKKADELYVRFTLESWKEFEPVIQPSGQGVQRLLLTSSYLLERASRLEELRLIEKELWREWRELRRLGDVRVKLDNEVVDEANVLDVVPITSYRSNR